MPIGQSSQKDCDQRRATQQALVWEGLWWQVLPIHCPHPEVSELQRHLYVGVRRHLALLHEALAVRIKHHEMQVYVTRERPRHRQALSNHISALQHRTRASQQHRPA